VLVYCWRGGERSLSLAHVLSRCGFNVTLVAGGYKAYRRQVPPSVPPHAVRRVHLSRHGVVRETGGGSGSEGLRDWTGQRQTVHTGLAGNQTQYRGPL
jgi:hypothetical protein